MWKKTKKKWPNITKRNCDHTQKFFLTKLNFFFTKLNKKVTKLKKCIQTLKTNCDKVFFLNMTKLKKNFYQTKKKLWQNSTKQNQKFLTKLKKKLSHNFKLKLWQNLSQIVILLKTQIVIVQIVTVVTVVVIVTSFSKNNLTPRQPMRFSQGSFCDSRNVF